MVLFYCAVQGSNFSSSLSTLVTCRFKHFIHPKGRVRHFCLFGSESPVCLSLVAGEWPLMLQSWRLAHSWGAVTPGLQSAWCCGIQLRGTLAAEPDQAVEILLLQCGQQELQGVGLKCPQNLKGAPCLQIHGCFKPLQLHALSKTLHEISLVQTQS